MTDVSIPVTVYNLYAELIIIQSTAFDTVLYIIDIFERLVQTDYSGPHVTRILYTDTVIGTTLIALII